jgi:hypothetical protein
MRFGEWVERPDRPNGLWALRVGKASVAPVLGGVLEKVSHLKRKTRLR